MARDISVGIDALAQKMAYRQAEQNQMQWRDLRNKIDSLLLSTNILKSDEARKACLQLDTLSKEERETFIIQNWGPNYLNRVFPLLHQLTVLENHINSSNKEETPNIPIEEVQAEAEKILKPSKNKPKPKKQNKSNKQQETQEDEKLLSELEELQEDDIDA